MTSRLSGKVTDLDAVIWLIVLALFMGFCFWKFPALMKEIFSFKKKPVEPAEPVTKPSPPAYPGKAISRADSLAYEDMGYINEPIQAPAPVVNLKHEIVKHTFSRMLGEVQPKWVCKCGSSGYFWVHQYRSFEQAQRDARKAGASHVYEMNKAEEALAKSNGNFAF